jgi:predicted metalloprotease with PDZ domain
MRGHAPLVYRLDLAEAGAHRLQIELRIPAPAAELTLSLPVWAPGSYLVREFARHVMAISAEQGGVALAVEPLDKSSWRVQTSGRGLLTLRYEIHAFDATVRTAFLDAARGYFNEPAIFLRVHGREHAVHEVRLSGLPRSWQVATSMPGLDGVRAGYVAVGYDDLIDHPFELGAFWRSSFRAGGVDFEFVVSGAWPGFDGDRLLADVRRICSTQLAFWHGRGRPPFTRYVFLLHASEEGYGGLEHRTSCALVAARRDLPRLGETERSDGYVGLLGLISHEFFHAWNVKRLRPREFLALDTTRENPTRLLWFFEGVTSYYDDLLLLRAGLIDTPRYLGILARHVQGVLATPGRLSHSVAQASFDAWIKFYRADENTPNATVSYYTKGSLVALALDLTLRAGGRGSLDDVMRLLWQRHADSGLTEADIGRALQDVSGRSFAAELQAWVHGTADLPLQPLLEAAGVGWRSAPAGLAASLGLRLSEGPVSGVQVKHVLRGSAAESAGLSPGDELLAVDGWRIRRFDDARQWVRPGAAMELLLVRQQRVLTRRIEPAGDAAPAITLSLQPGGLAHRSPDAWPQA